MTSSANRQGNLIAQGAAFEAALSNLCGGWTVSAFGTPECMPAVIVRPITGETLIDPGSNCQCRVTWLISAYAELCAETSAYEAIYALMSGCNSCGIIGALESAQSGAFKGIGRISVGAPGTFGFTGYNDNAVNNAYAATVQVEVRYCCCGTKEEIA